MIEFFFLILNRILSLYSVFKYKLIPELDMDIMPSKIMVFAYCIIIPIQEEIIFRYALYHLLEKYIEDYFYINIINGVIFGVFHFSNGISTEFTTIHYIHTIIFNSHLGYYLSTIHDNLILCMFLHCMYNIIGFSVLFYIAKKETKEEIVMGNFSSNRYINMDKGRRRAKSLNKYDSYIDRCIIISESKINKDILKSFEEFEKVEGSRKLIKKNK
jgi:hypothetical protein